MIEYLESWSALAMLVMQWWCFANLALLGWCFVNLALGLPITLVVWAFSKWRARRPRPLANQIA